ncbi:exported hypothetical protein [anaerobic digester metagenome]|uniref:PsbP C-terminal domain-containing protein n=1 Tax=anaerobic digester metagenome TaxID=1263854 RepID=A0A485M687_9ZZZZ
MKVFKYFMVLVLVFALLAVAGCSGETGTADLSENQSENGTSDDTGGETGGETGGKTITPDVEVKVTPPEGWEEEESNALLLLYNKGPSNFMVVQDKVPGNIAGLDGYLGYAKEALSETYSSMEFGSVESLKVGGHDSRKFFCTYEAANMPFKLVIVYVFRDGYIYNLQGCALAEDFDALLPEFEEFISSFRFE